MSPRDEVVRFARAKTSELEPELNPAKHYAITCFYVRTGHRKRGLMTDLAEAAIDYARKKKAAALDVCPIDTDKPLMWGEGFVGIVSVFAKLGFKEVAALAAASADAALLQSLKRLFTCRSGRRRPLPASQAPNADRRPVP